MSRREFGVIATTGLATLLLGDGGRASLDRTRIAARPKREVSTSLSGTRPLELGGSRGGVVRIPRKRTDRPSPLLVLLHGAGSNGAVMLRRLGDFAEDAGIVVLAPDSRGSTWDAIRHDFGPDPEFIDRALEYVFARVAVDAVRVSIGGFSDGATYALSLGLANGDLFSRILAFSPGFYVGSVAHGRPRIFVTHGTADAVLPIDRCSRVIVPALRKQGYDVTYRQFDGGHEIPPHLAREAMRFAT